MIRVLVADDSALMRRLLADVFSEDEGFTALMARDGVEALEALETFKPDVVTLDIHMPRMDGLTCLDRIMLQRPCPVLMLSSATSDGADATMQALGLGAVDFLQKPNGALSLQMDAFGPALREAVRRAAASRVSGVRRLRERVRERVGGGSPLVPTSASRACRSRADDAQGLVLVGTSTGGPPALEALLTGLPADFSWPIVVAQHMPAMFTAALARRLNDLCALDVVEVGAPSALQAGRVHIARGDADLVVSRRPAGLVAMSAPPTTGALWRPSVDRMVESAMAHVAPELLVGVLMTGMGDDGARSMAALRRAGGYTLAEAEETAVVWGMPGALVRAGGANEVAPLDKLAARLVARIGDRRARSPVAAARS